MWGIIALALGLIISGILLLKQSAKSFSIDDKLRKSIEQRNKDWQKEEDKND